LLCSLEDDAASQAIKPLFKIGGIYTMRGENIRLISLRKANKREKDYYEEKT
jgi:uncharacterized DUF497 family protein